MNMDSMRETPVQQDAALADWRTGARPEVEALGWQQFVRVDEPDDDVRIAYLDVVPERDISVVAEGPATFCIAIMLEGEGSVSIDGGRPLDVRPGTAVVFSSEGVVRGENTVRADRRVRLIDIRYERQFLRRAGGYPFGLLAGSLLVDRSVAEQNAILVGFSCPRALLDVARQIGECAFGPGNVRRLFLRAKALEVLALVVATLDAAAQRPTALGTRDRQKVDSARQLLQDRFDEPWTIARLARAVGLNERKLKSGFRHTVGRSIHTYLLDVRIDAAASMLDSGVSVTKTALAVGFNSLSHFSKTFRTRKGNTPRGYRMGRRG
jgi:AraC-like DNA-binding protein